MKATMAPLMIVLLAAPAIAATSPDTADALRDAPPPRIEISPDRPRPSVETPRRSGNPLWSIPLRTLTSTRDRPIFSPSRRPLAPAVVHAPVTAPVAPPSPAPLEQLNLALIGTVAGDAESFAILIDAGTNQIVRLRTGDAHGGWLLKSVQGREVTLQKGQRIETLRLPKSGEVGAPRLPGPPRPEQQL